MPKLTLNELRKMSDRQIILAVITQKINSIRCETQLRLKLQCIKERIETYETKIIEKEYGNA